MKPRSAKQRFLRRLAATGHGLAALTPPDGIAAMLRFYAEERADGCDVADDGDMLLYQWGAHDWGAGEAFELNITRQFLAAADDEDEPRQLSLTFRFRPSAALRAVVNGHRWCESPDGLAAFRRSVTRSKAYGAVAALRPAAVSLAFGRA